MADTTDTYAIPLVDPTLNSGLGGWICGACRSADDWMDVPPGDPFCYNCGTRVDELWVAAWYAFEV